MQDHGSNLAQLSSSKNIHNISNFLKAMANRKKFSVGFDDDLGTVLESYEASSEIIGSSTLKMFRDMTLSLEDDALSYFCSR